ncbi:APA family basic amino acid/polyamine antiporter [Thermonema lapsum]|uniref:APA family basic amino acid/polyamine antiporter n=1 Tax=Thermonema lapsum TaxID=28195 RepID=A0A846MMW9_9BACT|nr:amino acid permease [Thermonema lapsum]NIK72898.1 APA family basic amino acid/polyamine antiporter [Thermonema lapsum]
MKDTNPPHQIKKAKVSLQTAIAVVVANMIGTGVFTSLGYQAKATPSAFPILMLWLVGGIVALCGALSYGELASRFPRSGGEYHYLSRIYHPVIGFLSGWVSMTVGFAAPVALSAVAFGTYFFSVFPWASIQTYAVVVLIFITLIHLRSVELSGIFQNYSTGIKVGFLLFFIGLGFWLAPAPLIHTLKIRNGDWDLVFSGGFAISLAFVSFAYSGWNASAYIANEVNKPHINVSRSLLIGAGLVATLYLLLHIVFLTTLNLEELASMQAANPEPIDVGYLSAKVFLGDAGAKMMAFMIAIILVSSISAMTWAGPRVSQVIGEDLQLFHFFAYKNPGGVPTYAILFQSSVALILILSASFESILYAIAFILDTFTFLTVLGLILAKSKGLYDHTPTYKTWGYPFVPLIFLAGTGWTMYFLLKSRTYESMASLLWLFIGYIVYRFSKKNKL